MKLAFVDTQNNSVVFLSDTTKMPIPRSGETLQHTEKWIVREVIYKVAGYADTHVVRVEVDKYIVPMWDGL